jgi:prolyl-tRNA editing enzyme YbaK/EbsC (Cys-tRNA(Pro) deacylase)
MGKIGHARVDDALAALNPSRFRILQHAALAEGIRSAADLAHAVGVGVERVAKTVLVGDHGRAPERRTAEPAGSYVAVCLPAPSKINLSTLAEIFHWSGSQLATTAELDKVLGFQPGAVSPLGVGVVPLVVDEALMAFGTIFVGSGAMGMDIEIDPRDLVVIAKARVENVAITSPGHPAMAARPSP